MKILFISHYSGFYGANQSLLRLMIELRDFYGIIPFVLVRNEGEFLQKLDENNIPYFKQHYYWWVNENKGLFQKTLNIRKQFLNIKKIREIISEIKSENFDLVYSNSIVINIGYFISKKLKKPHIWHLRETLDAYNFRFSLGKFYSKYFLEKGSDKYILISKFLMESYVKLLPLNKCKVIYNGIKFSESVVAELRKENKYLNLCIIGVISEQKNQLEAIKAISLVLGMNIKVHLHIVGTSKEPYYNVINNYAKDNNLESNVIFYGHLEKIEEFLDTMDIGIVCSVGEAFGRVSIEYMRNYMPVIASNSGANPELIKDGYNGFLYELNNEEELASKILLLIKDKDLMRKMGENGYNYAIENFTLDKTVSLIYNEIQNVISIKNN